MKVTALLASTVLLTTSLAQELRRCATPPPSAALLAEAEILPSAEQRRTPIQVNTYIHVVTNETEAPKYDQAIVERQIDVMNDAYAPSGISFRLAGNDFTINTEWADGGLDGSPTEFAMKTRLRRGTYQDLNLYFLSGLGGGLLGFCYFPEKKSDFTNTTFVLDGCTNLASSMPGGASKNYDLGLTAVHETGHWFGVFHVFQNFSCEGKGDYVLDTPIQSVATSGCPVSQDSCPGSSGNDSIDNYMDYSYDACYRRFTFGQTLNMYKNFFLYRAGR